jgi:hypothetical protein
VREIAQALAQRRQAQARDVEAEVQVGAEAAGPHLGAEIAARRGDDARAERERRRAADPLVAALLEHVEQGRLEAGLELADLVEEERAAGGALEAPRAARDRAGEGAALVPEELALEERARQGRAVRVDERPCAARRQRVQSPGGDALAGAGLAEDEDVAVERRERSDLAAELAHGGALADERSSPEIPILSLHHASVRTGTSTSRRRAGLQRGADARAQEFRCAAVVTRCCRRRLTDCQRSERVVTVTRGSIHSARAPPAALRACARPGPAPL